jgi:hypothetical protein
LAVGDSGGGGLGGIFSLITAPLKLLSLFGLEGGGIIPSAEGGMVVGAGGAVADGEGGRLIIGHPQEMMLPRDLSLGVQAAIRGGNFGPLMPGGAALPRIPANVNFPASTPQLAAASVDGAGGSAEGTAPGGGDTHNHNWNISGVLNHRDVQNLLMTHGETIARSMSRQRRNFNPNS